MKVYKYCFIATIVACLVSCSVKKSSSANSVTLTIEENGMGDFTNYGSFEGEVTIKPGEDSEKNSDGEKKYVMSIPLKITSAVAWKYNLDFELTVTDDSHNAIAELDDLNVDGETDFDNGDFDSYLLTGPQRQSYEVHLSDEIWEKIKEEGKYLVIKCEADSKDRVPYIKGNGRKSSINESLVSSDEDNDFDDTSDDELDN